MRISVRSSGVCSSDLRAIASDRFPSSAAPAQPSMGAVPAEAFVPRSGREGGVFTVGANGRARFVRLRLVRFEADDAVVAGLSPGTRVVTAGAGYLKDGDPVLVAGRDREVGVNPPALLILPSRARKRDV